ncbi:helix-hairpin-helix domain-containing protein [Nocardioides nitrophenolicus]|uniref:helix-hairpin-helix domain-containing protein n=1 Tax=Nocardioides nitrophenolicus TaxID=60489 RepID=UPI001EF820F0|nr:helix-hairpin-helix domain-containing protein [Nocardioides nitrophenolicus]MBM7519712.1 competence protein ComEA [Nocardioides nitrophenolicus]
MSVRRSTARSEPPADAAARRLALIAADLGVAPVPAGSALAGSVPAVPAATGSPAADPVEPWWADHTRIADPVRSARAATGESPGPVLPALPVPALPEPGRHAARRRRSRPTPRPALAPLVDRLPTLGLPQVAVVALVVAVGLAVTTWWVMRERPEALSAVAAEPTAPLVAATPAAPPASVPSGAPAGEASPTSGATVTIDVAGKVRRPGIVVLDAGARVTDALTAAGGARRGVDLTPLNLARVLVDGEQIVVGGPARSGATPPATTGPDAAAGPLVNLNTAGQAELESLPQVGPVTAQSIIAWRDAHGGFTSIDELLEVDGIGPKTLAQITPHATV